MARKPWLMAAPAAVLLGVGSWSYLVAPTPVGAGDRIVGEDFMRVERKLGYHLYAPTWLPHNGRRGINGARIGHFRVLYDYVYADDRPLLFVAQERRSPERDAYNRKTFVEGAEAEARIGDKRGYLVTGKTGEARLYWNEPDAAVILSSPVLSFDELVKVAQKMR
ncbi:MAG: hypothetical protein ACK47B_05480 [Armatimonadota bacterium]